jgi:uncharacterized protein (TIGR03437 family)
VILRTLGIFLAAAALPAAEFSVFIGDANRWQVSRLITDTAGDTWVAGNRSFNLSFDPVNPNWVSEAIAAKLDPTGKTLTFVNIGGKGNDAASTVGVDRAGNIYLAGSTTSPNFPVRNALFATPAVGGGPSGFVAKFSPDGTDLIYSTYFPAPVTAMAVDADGNAYITGTTMASGVPVTPGLPGSAVGGNGPLHYGAFLTKISPAGDKVVYSTIVSGSNKPCGCCSSCFTSPRGATAAAVAVDSSGNAYMVGTADVTDLPVTAGALRANGIGAFVAKVNAAGTGLAYLTYLGNGMQVVQPYLAAATAATALAVDAAGNAYVAGRTWDPHLPVTTGAYQTAFHGWSEIDNFAPTPPDDAYAIKLNPAGTAVVWGSYLGGAGVDQATAAAVDAAGNLWVAGTTRSTEFPNAQGWSTGNDFIVEFNGTGTALPYSGRYPGATASQTLAIDGGGLLHVATPTGVVSAVAASAHPAVRPWVVANAASNKAGGQVVAGEVISIYGPHIGPFPAVTAAPVNGFMPTTLGGTQVLVNGIPAPLLYASDSQINAVVPFGVAGQAKAAIQVVNQGAAAGPPFQAAVFAADPAGFPGAVLNQDGTVNSAANPAAPGSTVALWATGVRLNPYPTIPDGQVAAAAQDFFCCSVYALGHPLAVPYGGAAPGLVAGVVQINVTLPAGVANEVTLSIVSGGATGAAGVFVTPAAPGGQ